MQFHEIVTLYAVLALISADAASTAPSDALALLGVKALEARTLQDWTVCGGQYMCGPNGEKYFIGSGAAGKMGSLAASGSGKMATLAGGAGTVASLAQKGSDTLSGTTAGGKMASLAGGAGTVATLAGAGSEKATAMGGGAGAA